MRRGILRSHSSSELGSPRIRELFVVSKCPAQLYGVGRVLLSYPGGPRGAVGIRPRRLRRAGQSKTMAPSSSSVKFWESRPQSRTNGSPASTRVEKQPVACHRLGSGYTDPPLPFSRGRARLVSGRAAIFCNPRNAMASVVRFICDMGRGILACYGRADGATSNTAAKRPRGSSRPLAVRA
ncbi:hypothetical protein TcYC6_0001140 [Trypanosoma cruzi]|nr:hypothetical protein TcYC6_0001140 [Trypanosoma cruzi]